MANVNETPAAGRDARGNKRRAAVALVAAMLGMIVAAAAWWWLRPAPGTYADVQALMAARYGAYDAGKQHWVPATQDAPDLAFRICAEETVRAGEAGKVLVAACGFVPDGGSHADSGRIDFFVLGKVRGGLQVLAASEGNSSGSFGEPGKVAVVRLGREFFGFQVEDGWSGQGIHIGVTRLFVPQGKTLKPALELNTLLDNEDSNMCMDDPGACTRLQRTLVIDRQRAKAATYPLRITEQGTMDGRARGGEFRLAFDKGRWGYPLPAVFAQDDRW